MKEIFKFKQTFAWTLISGIVYFSVATLFGEYVISREVPVWIQLPGLILMGVYTIWQVRYVAKYFINLLNL